MASLSQEDENIEIAIPGSKESSPEYLVTGENGFEGAAHFSEDEGHDTTGDDEADGGQDATVQKQMRSVSFGALLEAQNEIGAASRKRKRGSTTNDETEAKLTALRARLKELSGSKKKEKPASPGKQSRKPKISKLDANSGDGQMQSSASDFESSDHDESTSKKSKPSKHAPAEQSSKLPVTRKRPILEVRKAKVGDPRFGSASEPVDVERAHRNYAFLDQYLADEIQELKDKIKNARSAASQKKKRRKKGLTSEEIDKLKRELRRKEAKQKAQLEKEREKEVIAEHKQREKEMAKKGKQPFHLKQSEIKKRVLIKKFEGMGEAQKDRAIERKRKKMAAKERKAMPDSRRN